MTITLNGYVVADNDLWVYQWFEMAAFSPAVVRNALKENPEGEDLVLEINSPGGSAFAAFEMYSLLRGAKCRTVAQIQSLAASAASIVMSGCQAVKISQVAQKMIHMPSVSTSGNQEDHKASIRILDSITESILNGYELKCAGKASRHKLEQLMQKESWITAQEALDLGLADVILWQDDESSPAIPKDVVNAVGGGIRSLAAASPGMPNAEDLMSRYRELVSQGAAPAEGHPVELPRDTSTPTGMEPENTNDRWRREARLVIEKNRF